MAKVSGVYAITNTVNGKIYIGSSVNVIKRKSQHFDELRKGTHGSGHLQAAYSKYGPEAFVFSILEYTPREDTVTCEQRWLDSFDRTALYNIRLKAESNIGIVRSAETRALLSAINTGKRHSEETKVKMRVSRPTCRPSATCLENSLKKRIRKVKQMDLEGNVIAVWGSIKEAGSELGINLGNIGTACRKTCRRGYRSAGGFRWEYADRA